MNEEIFNASAERGILSIILQDVDAVIQCSEEGLFYQHFYIPVNKNLYSIICYLVEEGIQKFDSNIIYSAIRDDGIRETIDKVGGRRYIDTLLVSNVIPDNLKTYIKQVKECDKRRRLCALAEALKKECIEEDDITLLMEDAQKKIFELTEDNSNTEVKKVGDSLIERLKERTDNPSTVLGLCTGWEKFDKITKGLRPNDLIVAIAPSKTGKSFFLANIAKQLSLLDGLPGLYIDTEMETEEQENRMLAMLAKVPIDEIETGFFSRDTEFGKGEDKIKRVMESAKRMEESKLFHIYMPQFTIEGVSATIRKYYIKEKIEYAIFDYIKLPTSDVSNLNNSKEYERLGYFTTCLKDMAGICGIPIITAGQTNRADLDTTDPDASNIGGSYRILQMATKVLFLRNKTDNELMAEGYSKGNYKVHIKYQRHGSSDEKLDFQFDRPIGSLYEI